MIQLMDNQIQSKDRLLPIQDALKIYFKQDMADYYTKLHELLMSFNVHGEIGLENLDLELPEKFTYYAMGSDLPSLQFLCFLIKMVGCKNILEIGTFIGVSAMHMANAAGNGHVTTVEVGEEFYNIAKRNVVRNNYGDKVTVLHADAKRLVEVLPKDEKFDLIYLDGDKGSYCQIFLRLLPFLANHGVFIIDDVLFNGDVLNASPTTEKGIGVKQLLDEVKSHQDLDAVLLPLSNGKLFVRRRL